MSKLASPLNLKGQPSSLLEMERVMKSIKRIPDSLRKLRHDRIQSTPQTKPDFVNYALNIKKQIPGHGQSMEYLSPQAQKLNNQCLQSSFESKSSSGGRDMNVGRKSQNYIDVFDLEREPQTAQRLPKVIKRDSLGEGYSHLTEPRLRP